MAGNGEGQGGELPKRFGLAPGKSGFRFVCHLVATRTLQTATRECLIGLCKNNNMNVHIHGKPELRTTMTWPEDVRGLHPICSNRHDSMFSLASGNFHALKFLEISNWKVPWEVST